MFLESVIFVLLIIILIIILQLKKNFNEKLEFLYLKIEHLSSLLANKNNAATAAKTEEKPAEQIVQQETFKPFTPYQRPKQTPREPVVVPELIVPEPEPETAPG